MRLFSRTGFLTANMMPPLRASSLYILVLLVPLHGSLASPHARCAEIQGGSALALYDAGCTAEAKTAVTRLLQSNNVSLVGLSASAPRYLLLQQESFLERESANFEAAISFAHRAFEAAKAAGRSDEAALALTWLGKVYKDLGMFSAARSVLDEACRYDPDAKHSRLGTVWAQCTAASAQLRYETGERTMGTQLLHISFYQADKAHNTTAAVDNGIEAVNILYAESELSVIAETAVRTVSAARKCDCGSLRLSRAKLGIYKALALEAKAMPDRKPEAVRGLTEFVGYAENAGDIRSAAEARMLFATLLDDSGERTKQRCTAFRTLRHFREAFLSAVTSLQTDGVASKLSTDLERFYVTHAIPINAANFRKIADSFLSSADEAAARMPEARRVALRGLIQDGARPQEAPRELSAQLAQLYQELGFFLLAARTAEVVLLHPTDDAVEPTREPIDRLCRIGAEALLRLTPNSAFPH